MAAPAPIPKTATTAVPTAIEQYFQVCLLLLLSTGFLTLTATGKLDAISSVLMSAALLYRGYLLGHGAKVRIPERVTSFLGLIYILIYILDFFYLSSDFVLATVHLLLFGIIIKLFAVYRDRDYAYLAMLAFLEMLSAAILTVDSVFLGFLGLFLLIAVVTFIALEMRRSSLRGGPVQHMASRTTHLARKKRLRVFSYALSTTGITLVAAILLMSVGIFFVMPRMSGGYMSKLAQENNLVTGFSDNVSLGEIGRIQQSSQIAMHVRIGDGQKGPGVLMRGNALSDFDGKSWLNPPRQVENLVGSGGYFDLQARLPEERLAVGRTKQTVRYRVVLEPIGTSIIFTIPTPVSMLGKFREVAVDNARVFLNTDREHPTTVYTATSDLSQPTLEEFDNAIGAYPEEVQRRYLRVPKELDPRVGDLAREITQNAKTPLQKAAAIQSYLSKFRYTLELPSQKQKDPISYFLFERKAGHCEYFASAMAILLREVGVPTRIVTGFRGGEWNQLTGNFIIRAKDAHSWVEVYFAGLGWYGFDPTPAGGAPVVTTWSRIQLYLDAAQDFWREWIVNYDSAHQQQLTTAAINRGARLVENLKRWARRRYASMVQSARETHRMMANSPRAYAGAAVLFVAGLLLLFNVPRLARVLRAQHLARNPARAPRGAASIWYRKMTRAMERRGHRKLPNQTPEEFVDKIADQRLKYDVARFTEHYERARFGNSAEDAQELPKIYEELVGKK